MIILKSQQEIEKMRISNRIVAEALNKIEEVIDVGITTAELDKIAESVIRKNGAEPAFKGYRGFPNTLCASVNEEVVHGIPSQRRLKEGDIVSLDLGVFYEGYYGDAAITIGVGKIDEKTQRLLNATREALFIGIEKVKEGNYLYSISGAIQRYVEGLGFSVVRAFVGHGIGVSLHEEPQIPNFVPLDKCNGPRLKKGMVLAIEPMVNMGSSEVCVLDDNWTVVTADRTLSSHFEHTVAITENGVKILSQI
ncbi:MAG: type I methionyl aminopeptidase [Nitrospinae bacterium]|nr:type I methionyl aminopeptidase [Nitrospinota bacterium]